MKHFLLSLLVLATLAPYTAMAADSYGFAMFFSIPGPDGSTESKQYFSKLYLNPTACSAAAGSSGANLGLPAGATRDTSKPITCNCSATLESQGEACAPAKFTAAQVTLSPGGGSQGNDSVAFVPLTSIPGIESAGNAETLPKFLNELYKLAIGLAAVLAVLQIVRAGVMYMGGDSVWEKKEAKNLIAMSVGGLILVLSPVIVFSIINPSILSLKIGGLDELANTGFTEGGNVRCEPACTGGTACVGGACVAPPGGVGDGTCSVECVTGRVCQAGQCVVGTSEACTSTYSNGETLTTVQAQNCCAAQPRCTVQVRAGPSGDLPIAACSCTAPVERGAIDGQFMSKIAVANTPAVSAFRSACSTSNILAVVRQVVKSRNLTEARDTLFCESEAQPFFEYQLKKKSDGTVGATKWVPEDEAKRSLYTNGCRSDGGTLQRDTPRAWGQWGATCFEYDGGAGVAERIYASEGVSKDNYQIRCRSYEPRCIKY